MAGTCCRHLEEILGLGTLGALQGRVKRHMAAAGLSTLLVAVAGHNGQFVVPRLAKIMAVCLRALAESKAFMVWLLFLCWCMQLDTVFKHLTMSCMVLL